MEISQEPKKEESKFRSLFKSFDYYRTLPSDITESTYSGVFGTISSFPNSRFINFLVSIICVGLIIFFVHFELVRFFETNVRSEMFIDVMRGSEKVKINIFQKYFIKIFKDSSEH